MSAVSSFCFLGSFIDDFPFIATEEETPIRSLRSMWVREVFWKREMDYPVLLPQATPPKSPDELQRWFFDPQFHEDRSKVEKIKISGNFYFSHLPAEIGQLKGLKVFSAIQTNLVRIEEGSIEKCKELEKLVLRVGKLSELPDVLGEELSELKTLTVAYQRLGTVPLSFQGLKKLKKLDLSGNPLSGFPRVLQYLTQLEELEICGAGLEELPDWIGDLRNLRRLSLSCNGLQTIPKSIGKLKQLEYLDLSGNQLVSLPSSLGELTSLQKVDLSANHLISLPREIGRCSNLVELSVSGNQLKDLPSIPYLKKLRQLNLFNNRLEILCPSVWACKSLVFLNVAGNSIVGVATHPVREVIEKNRGTFIF